MKKISVFTVSLLLLTLALSCQNKKNAQTPADGEASAASDTDYGVFAEDGDSLLIPTFEIEVSNSVKTNQMLTKQKETVLVAANFYGDPKDEKDKDDVGQLQIIDKEVELTGDARIARFSGIKFSKQVYEKLADKDLRVLVYVVSGRRSSEDNLLDCGLMDLKASQFMDKRFLIGCKLNEEPAQAGAGMESNSGYPIACYALPPAGEAPVAQLNFLVTCSETGDMEWAGQPMADLEALKAAIRPVLADMVKNGAKELPGIETQGCMMGASGAIKDMYEELKGELGKKR